MSKQINSEWYSNTNDMVWFRYYLDNDGMWYNYKDLYECLQVSGRKAEGMYKDLYEGNKRIYADINNESIGIEFKETQFINVVGLLEIQNKVKERFKTVFFNIQQLEQQLGLFKPNDENNYKFKVNVDLLMTEINSNDRDYDKLSNYARIVCESDVVQKAKNENQYYIDPAKEKIINNFRNDMYAYDDIEEVEYKISTADDEREKRVAVYKKFKKAHPNSSLPEWIVDVIN